MSSEGFAGRELGQRLAAGRLGGGGSSRHDPAGMAGTTGPEQDSRPITLAMHQMEQEVSALDKRLMDLLAGLGPILGPETPEVAQDRDVPPASHSQFADFLEVQTNKIAQLRNAIMRTIDRMEF